MVESNIRPRLTRFDDVAMVVAELRKLGVSGRQLYRRVADVGPVDLDVLNAVLDQQPPGARSDSLRSA